MTGTLFGGAETVELQAGLDAEILPQTCGKRQQFDVNVRTAEAQRFATELIELAVAAALRTFVPEHRTKVPQTLRRVVGDVVFNGAAANGARAFWTKRKLFAVHRIGKGIHLLFNDVGGFTHAAGKEPRGFENGRTNLTIAVACRHTTGRILKLFPDSSLFGQHVVHALDAGNFDFCHCSFLVLIRCLIHALVLSRALFVSVCQKTSNLPHAF